MDRDRAIEIATKFAAQFPKLDANATQVSGPDWCLRLALPSGIEVRAQTVEAARILWSNVALLTRIGAAPLKEAHGAGGR